VQALLEVLDTPAHVHDGLDTFQVDAQFAAEAQHGFQGFDVVVGEVPLAFFLVGFEQAEFEELLHQAAIDLVVLAKGVYGDVADLSHGGLGFGFPGFRVAGFSCSGIPIFRHGSGSLFPFWAQAVKPWNAETVKCGSRLKPISSS
jgi:hypothetical protein